MKKCTAVKHTIHVIGQWVNFKSWHLGLIACNRCTWSLEAYGTLGLTFRNRLSVGNHTGVNRRRKAINCQLNESLFPRWYMDVRRHHRSYLSTRQFHQAGTATSCYLMCVCMCMCEWVFHSNGLLTRCALSKSTVKTSTRCIYVPIDWNCDRWKCRDTCIRHWFHFNVVT